MTQRLLLLLDAATLANLANAAPPASTYSHDKNLFQLAHEALRRGWQVGVASAQDHAAHGDPARRPVHAVRAVYPAWEWSAAESAAEWRPDAIAAVHPEALNLRFPFPDAKLVALHAAVHWVENPLAPGAQFVFDLITAVRYNIDVIVTQNARMAELLRAAYGLLARWPYAERIVVAPLGIVAEEQRDASDLPATRARMHLDAGAIPIVNAGGVWRWTDFNSFLAAFAQHAEADPATPLRLFVMGLLQPANTDHADYVAETEALLYRHRALLGRSILVHNHWDDAASRVRAYTRASRIGLNVNGDSLENWQSHRVRMLDYLAAGLPAIQTRGDLLAEAGDGAHAFLVRPGNLGEYRDVLNAVAADPGLLAAKQAAALRLARAYDSRITWAAALDAIERLPRRPERDHAAWGDCVLDYAAAHFRREAQGRMRDRLAGFADQLLAP